MKAILHPNPQAPHQVRAMEALAEGMRQHGVEVERLDNRTQGEADIDVIWSRRQLGVVTNRALILECGYLNGRSGDYKADRLRFIAPCWDDVHNLAAEPPEATSERWEALGLALGDWKTEGDYALILAQVPNDTAVEPASAAEYRTMIEGWRAELLWTGDVRIREHPLIKPSENSLEEDLAGAYCAVTWSSTAAVEAILAGVPTVVMGEISIAWPVSSHRLTDPLWRGDRLPWCYRLAYRQWTLTEFRDGTAWEWLKYALTTDHGPLEQLPSRERAADAG